jgi:GT2 family glycosyltransferase
MTVQTRHSVAQRPQEAHAGPTSTPQVSVIVVAYNDRPYLEACLASLLDQALPLGDYEVIYADNASTDGSSAFVAETFPQVRVVQFDQNYGFTGGNNRAVAHARGRYLVFQNADTVVHRRWLSEMLRALQAHPQARGCHPAALPLNFGGYNERHADLSRGYLSELTAAGYTDFAEIDLDRDPFPTLFIAGGSAMIDRQIMAELRYVFDEDYFIYSEDTDLGLRINALGYQVLFVPSAITYHHRAPERRVGLSRKTVRMGLLVARNRFLTFYKHMDNAEFVRSLPRLYWASVTKARSMSLSRTRAVLYGLAMLPLTGVGLLLAVAQFPRYASKRRWIRQHNRRGPGWLSRALRHRRASDWLARTPALEG